MDRALSALEPDVLIERLRHRRQLRVFGAGILVAVALATAFALVVLTYNDDPEGQFQQQAHQAP
jgi:hypothetical protein